MIAVTNEMPIYEHEGKDCYAKGEKLRLDSHWNSPGLVVLVVDGKRLSVRAQDLRAALDNATNSARY